VPHLQRQKSDTTPEEGGDASYRSRTPALNDLSGVHATNSTYQLRPGTFLRGGRYRLIELLEHQEWSSNVYEAAWLALDMQRNAQVTIRELVVADDLFQERQAALYIATMSFKSIEKHPHIPMLWDVFHELGRDFFIFTMVDGESLQQRMSRSGGVLPEQEVVECCLQIIETLAMLSQQNPPVVHGNIRPENIILTQNQQGPSYFLKNFSIVCAGNARQLIVGIERLRITPYMAPQIARGIVDMRSDVYSLLATAYHAVTGQMPTGSSVIQRARQLNSHVSPQFESILSKGLRATAEQRYQDLTELHQDLMALRQVGALSGESAPMIQKPVSEEKQEYKLLVPAPETLPPFSTANDGLNAALLFIGIVVCMIPFLIGRGL